MSSLMILAVALLTPPPLAADTIRLEVGSPAVDARVYKPHRARVRIHMGGPDGPVTSEWMNELTLGDSAGRPVMRWVTTTLLGPLKGSALRQTYDGITMAPLGWTSEQTTGAVTRLAINGNRVVGHRRTATDTTPQRIERTVERRGFIASASDLIPLAVGMRKGVVIFAPVWGPNMATAEGRVFKILDLVRIPVEGKEWDAWKVEERRESDGWLVANWYLVDKSPYMVAGEMFLPDGRMQYASEIELPM